MANYFSAVKRENPRGLPDDVLEIFIDTYDIYRLNNLVAELGTYTFVVWYCSAADCNITFNVLGTEEKVASTTAWTKYIKTVEYDGSNNNIDIIPDLDSTIYLYEAYITKGNKDKSWSLAPEDIDQNFEDANSSIIESMTEAQQTATKFAWIVKSGTNETNFTLTSRTADLVAEQINLKGLVTFSALNSDAQNGISNIVDNKISDIEVGSSNLLRNTKTMSTYTGHSSITVAEDTEGFGVATYAATDTLVWRNFNVFPPIQYSTIRGKEVTFSMWFRSDDYEAYNADATHGLCPTFTLCPSNSTTRTLYKSKALYTEEISNEWRKVSLTVSIDDSFFTQGSGTIDDTTRMYMVIYNYSLYHMDVKKFKLEIGNVATDWTPAEEDKANQSLIDAWTGDKVVDGVTFIYGGYIQTNTIDAEQINVDNFMANSAVIGAIQATELNADMIKAGHIRSNLLDLYGLRVYQQDTEIETLSIENTGDVTLRGNVESYDYVAGESGWSIKSDGNAEFNNVVVRGDLINSSGGIIAEDSDIEGRQIIAWFGASYEERESAPLIFYNDGYMKSITGEFGGIFTGDIKIGNISIIDPSSHAGNDAIVTIQNGDNGIKRVQLTDLDSSKFAQNLLITDNFENTAIQLSQEGYVNAIGGYIVDKNSFDSNGIHLNGSDIIGNDNSINILTGSVDIGTLGSSTSLKVWGESVFNQSAKFNGDILLGSSMILSHTDDGFDINFVYNTITYTVTFESNGGSAVAPIRDVVALSTITAPTAPTRNGYSFAGWYKDSLLNIAFDFDTDTINDNTTLYAKWTVVPAVAPTCSITEATKTGEAYYEANNWTSPYVVNASTTDGGTLSYHWEVNYYEGSGELLAAEDVFANKTSNNISVDELNNYLYLNGAYAYLSGTCTVTNTKLGTTASTTVSVYVHA